MLKEFIVIFLLITIVFVGIVLVIGFGAYKYQVEIGQANYIDVYQGSKLICRDKLAFIDIKTGGMTTTIIIYKKLFPFPIVDRTYSSSDIKVVPVDRKDTDAK